MSESPKEQMAAMRLQALKYSIKNLAEAPPSSQSVFGVLIDWPYTGEVFTIVSLSDGNASLYSTTNFGIIGGFFHPKVAKVAKELVTLANPLLSKTQLTEDFSLPKSDQVKFFFLTDRGTHVFIIPLEQLVDQNSKSPFKNLFFKAHDLFKELRTIADV